MICGNKTDLAADPQDQAHKMTWLCCFASKFNKLQQIWVKTTLFMMFNMH